MSHLRNKTAIVTGSSQGIGKAIAAHFTEQGANVIVNSRTLERAEAAATKIAEETDGRTVPVAADVTDEAAMSALVETTVEEFGELDVMVNNAGITTIGPAEAFDVDEFRRIVDVNLTGTFIGSKVAGNRFIDQGEGGAILNVSSLMSSRGLHKRSPYSSSKAGVNNLTRTLAVEWAEHDIHVNALAPGYIRTEITEQSQGSAGYTDDDVRDRTPLGRFGTPQEMAECAEFLTAGNNFVTGEVLYADGGWKAYAWGAGDQ